MPVNPLDIKNGWQVLALAILMLPGIIAALLSWHNASKLTETVAKVDATSDKVDANTKHVNSRMDQLIIQVEAAAFGKGKAAGLTEGAATEKARGDAVIAAQAQPLAKPPADVTDSSQEESTPAKKRW